MPPEPQSRKAINIFVSYSHKDKKLKDKLLSQLSPLRHQGVIKSWDDQQIAAGSEWDKEILKHFNEADIILCLISPDFIDSDYCYGVQAKQAWERRTSEGIEIIPILLRGSRLAENTFS